MNIQRSSFYAWKKKLAHPSTRMKSLLSNILLFKEYHAKFPSHGYRWLNAKIRLDTGLVLSDAYAHKCCKITGIKSQAKHYKYKVDCKCKLNKIYQATISVEYTLSRKVSNSSSGL